MIVIGGGPSGTVAARLLASWGHSVLLVTRPFDPSRSLANSLPPSTRKLLEQVGIADLVEQVGFRTTGNTVWWGGEERVEPFAGDGPTTGYQIDRARLDPQLLDAAAQSGVRIVSDARVSSVHRDHATGMMRVSYSIGLERTTCRAAMVLDCSGRAGVLALGERLRRQVPGGRMQALLGVWEREGGWALRDPTHTFIETCDEGWAWSIPTGHEVRHVGIMVDGATSRLEKDTSLDVSYRRLLARLPRIHDQTGEARLARVFACDASVYTASSHAGPGFVLVGDAGCTLNPLSSFGVKKALASAWLGAVVANTCVRHPERAQVACRFFSEWTTQVWNLNLGRSRDFALEALARHPSAFWSAQASAVVDESALLHDERALLNEPDVRSALAHMREADTIVFSIGWKATSVSAPVVRGHEIAIEPAVSLGNNSHDVVRYLRGVDLVALSAMAPGRVGVPEVIELYQRTHGGASVPDILAALSVLTARGVLEAHARAPLAHL
ncbi:MAG: FAD-dependent monooxygenase [Vicinamibacterales bacterium]